MVTTISDPATFSSVRNAFNTEAYGISNSFKEYRMGNLANGPIVPYFLNEDFYGIGQATESDPLRLSQFNGIILPYNPAIISIDDLSFFNDQPGPTTYQLNADGNIYASSIGLVSPWKTNGAFASSLYDARMTRVNGFMNSIGAPLSTWLNLGTTRTWEFDSASLSDTTDCNLEIRLASTGELLDTATITFNYFISE
jgi:hypothetical protein